MRRSFETHVVRWSLALIQPQKILPDRTQLQHMQRLPYTSLQTVPCETKPFHSLQALKDGCWTNVNHSRCTPGL